MQRATNHLTHRSRYDPIAGHSATSHSKSFESLAFLRALYRHQTTAGRRMIEFHYAPDLSGRDNLTRRWTRPHYEKRC